MVIADCGLRGQRVRRGDIVLQFIGAANRDPAANADPGRPDLSRQSVKRVAFGYGAHFCFDAVLALLEGQVALIEFLMGHTKGVWERSLVDGRCASRVGFASSPGDEEGKCLRLNSSACAAHVILES